MTDLLKALNDDNTEELIKLLGGAPSTATKGDAAGLRRLNNIDKIQQKQRRELQNIGYPPDLVDWDRRQPCDDSLKIFYETYFSRVFSLDWSEDHERLIGKLEKAIINGDLSALAMARGSGKTAMIIRAAIWAMVTGRRNYIAIIAATETASQRLLKSIKSEILYNEDLKNDYSAELHCVVSLGNRAALAGGQHVDGSLTGVEWNVSHINLGSIADERCLKTNNTVCKAMGVTGNIRGEQVTTISGEIRRPDLVLIDDPQTKSSAGSKNQVNKRHETLMGDVLGMAGPGKSIAGLCAMTVIYANDLADRLLDSEQSPEWQGERCKMVYKWPDAMDLWDEYQSIYEEEFRAERGHEDSRKFIKKNFDTMHAGSHVGWEARYDTRKELSALHHAFNLKIRDAGAFAAEYQNEPMEGFDESPFSLDPEEISRRVIPNHGRNELPEDVETITCAVDVQKRLLFYMVCGWTPSSRCVIIDYGCYPEQKRMYFAKREAPISIQEAAKTDELDDALRYGLEELTNKLLTKEYSSGDAAPLMIDKLTIDARWGDSTEVIRRFCRESPHRSRMHPSMGVYIGANSRKWQKIRLAKRDKKGVHCKLQPPAKGVRGRPELLIDTNFWKTFVASRLGVNPTSNRAIVLFDAKPSAHRMIAEHFCSELPKKVIGKTGEVVTEWDQPKGLDNDWWDCLVYNCALASVLGVKTHDPRSEKRTQAPGRSNPSTSKNKLKDRASTETARERMERKRKNR